MYLKNCRTRFLLKIWIKICYQEKVSKLPYLDFPWNFCGNITSFDAKSAFPRNRVDLYFLLHFFISELSSVQVPDELVAWGPDILRFD